MGLAQSKSAKEVTGARQDCWLRVCFNPLCDGNKTHPLIFIVDINNFIEYLQRHQILLFIYYKFYYIIFIMIQYKCML